MDDKGFAFEERKTNQQNNKINDIEYSKGGDGGGDKFSRYGYVKSSVYSRHCYSDPENPGKIICKETRDNSGFNPFDPNDKAKNYKKFSENVYTKDYTDGSRFLKRSVNPYTDQNIEYSPSVWDKLSNRLKGIFTSSSEDKNKNVNKNEHDNNNNKRYNQPFDQKQYNDDAFDLFNQHMNQIFNDVNRTFTSELFGNSILNEFLRDSFSPLSQNQQFGRNFNEDTFDSFSSFGIPGFFSFGFNMNPNSEFNSSNNPNFKSAPVNFQMNTNNKYGQNSNINHSSTQQNIKYKDYKIYDV